jgi:ethanolamine ammonia-lyase small subunit
MTDLTPTDPWRDLGRLTTARIGLGRTGGSLPTREVLDFQLAHARARDAVHLVFDAIAIEQALAERGWPCLTVQSQAADRAAYLQNPNRGRRLSPEGLAALAPWRHEPVPGYDVAFVVADGLSALATHRHAVPLLDATLPALTGRNWRIAPIAIARQGRVALGDEIGESLGAEVVVVLIGERPGLGSADSLGVYLTYGPRVGRSDAERNCISNVRLEGLSYVDAARKIVYLLTEAHRLKLSGVDLKDEAGDAPKTLE